MSGQSTSCLSLICSLVYSSLCSDSGVWQTIFELILFPLSSWSSWAICYLCSAFAMNKLQLPSHSAAHFPRASCVRCPMHEQSWTQPRGSLPDTCPTSLKHHLCLNYSLRRWAFPAPGWLFDQGADEPPLVLTVNNGAKRQRPPPPPPQHTHTQTPTSPLLCSP